MIAAVEVVGVRQANLGQVGLQRHRLVYRRISQGALLWGGIEPGIEEVVCLGACAIDEREPWIEPDSLFQKTDRVDQRLLAGSKGRRSSIADQQLLGPQIEIVGFKILGWFLFDISLFFGRKRCGQLGSDGLSYFALDGENVGEITIKTVGPSGLIVASVDQLDADPNPVTVPAHRSFQYVRYTQRTGNLAQIAFLVHAVLHDRRRLMTVSWAILARLLRISS